VMETANHNIGDKLDELRRNERTLRQEAITSELIDVVIGSEAILGSGEVIRPEISGVQK
jgi:F0F1-type ATP synthase gamma subunit